MIMISRLVRARRLRVDLLAMAGCLKPAAFQCKIPLSPWSISSYLSIATGEIRFILKYPRTLKQVFAEIHSLVANSNNNGRMSNQMRPY